MEKKTVDVIIPAYRPGEGWKQMLRGLEGQTWPVHRLIVMNTGKENWKAAYEKTTISMEVHHLTREEFDHGKTRDQAARMSRADYLLFMTQDALPEDCHLIEKLVEAIEQDEKIGAAYARQLPREDCRLMEQYTRQFNYPEQSRVKTKADIPTLGIKTFFCSDVCAAYRRDLFEELGGFESPVIFNEDMFFAANAIEHGYGVAYAADAKVVHSHNYTMGQQFRRNFDLAVSQKQHSEIFEQVSSEAEGMKLVKSTIAYLFKIRKPWLIFHFGTQCVGKYAGFWMGKHYEKLSRKQILKYTMNPGYWDMREDVHE
mgnify:CR=1 FL=1